jgi:transcriptional regulator with XRE-family HTH domain
LVQFTRMTEFGAILKGLREARRMKQHDLAREARVSQSTIAKAELGLAGEPKRTTKIALLEALDARRRLTEDEFSRFTEAAGIKEVARAATESAQRVKQNYPGAMALGSALTQTPPAIHAAILEFLQLVDEVGPAAASTQVRSALQVAREAVARSSEDAPTFTVKHPPIQHQGYVEQVEVEYEARNPAKSAPASKLRAKQ